MKRCLSLVTAGDAELREIVTIGMCSSATVRKLSENGFAQGAWSEEEGRMLEKIVAECGEVHWSEVSGRMVAQGIKRDATQCRQRWNKVQQPNLKKGQWSEDEDQKLQRAVSEMLEIDRIELSKISWSKVAQRVTNRTSKACRERWKGYLDPTVNRGPWKPEEDDYLVKTHALVGNQWAQISRGLSGRTADQIKTRHQSLERGKKKEERKKQKLLAKQKAEANKEKTKQPRKKKSPPKQPKRHQQYQMPEFSPVQTSAQCPPPCDPFFLPPAMPMVTTTGMSISACDLSDEVLLNVPMAESSMYVDEERRPSVSDVLLGRISDMSITDLGIDECVDDNASSVTGEDSDAARQRPPTLFRSNWNSSGSFVNFDHSPLAYRSSSSGRAAAEPQLQPQHQPHLQLPVPVSHSGLSAVDLLLQDSMCARSSATANGHSTNIGEETFNCQDCDSGAGFQPCAAPSDDLGLAECGRESWRAALEPCCSDGGISPDLFNCNGDFINSNANGNFSTGNCSVVNMSTAGVSREFRQIRTMCSTDLITDTDIFSDLVV